MIMPRSARLAAAATAGLLTLALMAPAIAAERIAFVRTDNVGPYDKIITMQPNGKKQRTVLKEIPGPTRGFHAAQLSPDGSKLLYLEGLTDETGASWISVSKANGKDKQQVIVAKANRTLGTPAWSPDGKRIIFVETSPSKIWIKTAKANGKGRKTVRSFDSSVLYPSYSPDGKRIVFSKTAAGASHIATMKADGTGLRVIGKQDGFAFVGGFSPNGKRIVFNWHPGWEPHLAGGIARRSAVATAEVFTMKADGTGMKQVSEGAKAYSTPAYSPNGKRIIVTRRPPSSDSYDLYSIPAQGGKWKRLTRTTSAYNVFHTQT